MMEIRTIDDVSQRLVPSFRGFSRLASGYSVRLTSRLSFSWRDYLAVSSLDSERRIKLAGLEQDAWVILSPEAWAVFEPFVEEMINAAKEAARMELEHKASRTE